MVEDLPHDIVAEQAALGAIFLSPAVLGEVLESVRPGEFYRPAHRLILEACESLHDQGKPVDAVSVRVELARRGQSPRPVEPDYLHTLMDACPSSANGSHFGRIVAETAVAREVVEAGMQLEQLGRGPIRDIEELLAAAQEVVYRISQRRQNSDFAVLGDMLPGVMDEIEADTHRDGLPGLSSGFVDLDEATGGFRPGELWLIAARPSVGKSMLGLDMARAAAIKNGLPTALFSLEMSRSDIVKRLLSAEARVPLQNIRSGQLTDDDWIRLTKRLGEIADAPLFINDTSTITAAEIRTKARRLQATKGLRLVIVDYLQLMSSARQSENRQQEVSNYSRALKQMAQDLGITVIALSQLNRAVEQRSDKRPQMHDIRESGSLEQDSDGIIMLYRDDIVEPESTRLGEADLILVKNRSGPKGTVTVAFQGHYSRFVDMAN
jgi:replicative DNA helicase